MLQIRLFETVKDSFRPRQQVLAYLVNSYTRPK